MLYMCLRCDMLLLDPSFVFTVILASGSVSRLLPRPPDLSLGLTARSGAEAVLLCVPTRARGAHPTRGRIP